MVFNRESLFTRVTSMPLRKKLILASIAVLLAVLLGIWFTPLAVSNGVRLWVWWKARQEGLIVRIDRIDAPFLGPVAIGNLRVTSAAGNAFHIELTATQTSVGLNLRRILLRTRGRAIRSVSIQQLHGDLRRINPSGRAIGGGWTTLQKLLPQNLAVASSDMRVEDGPTVILLRNVVLSASEIEAGRFSAGEVMIASPWFRQTFSQLRGATNWQDNRLTLAGLTLTRGLDLQSITADLSRLSNQRVGLNFDVDAFGGKIRTSISHEWRSRQSNWRIAGSATDISLTQTSEAIGFTDRVGGLLHACNFTFRGNPGDPTRATASLWSELTGLTWRNRTAEAIMLGAALYNRQIELQQLYIKQKANQLTLSGEASFPSNSSDWLSPDFRGDISASIKNLGDFASLFGANPGDFAGEIVIDGAMNARDRKIGGHLTASGASLKVFRTSIDSLRATLNLKATELEIEHLDLKRKTDLLTAQGKIDMSHIHSYSGTINVTADNLTDYLSIFRGPGENNSKPTPVEVQITIASSRWNARGVIGAPDSAPVSFTADFPLRIGTDWNAFLASPLNVTLDFPSVFLANSPQFFHPNIFRDGILTGKIALTEALRHPRIIGDVQLIGGKLENAPLNLTEANSRVTFAGQRASIDFLNVTTKDVDLSFGGGIDFHDTNNLAITITAATPIFDLTPRPIDCVSKVELGSVAVTLAPAVAEFDIRGEPFRSNWTVSLKERTNTQFSAALDLTQTARTLPLCLGTSPGEKTLLLGATARPEAHRETVRPKKRAKHR
jgi:hypothetical protein